uniref:Uncharacterized protein n=1 Tax=Oryza brachyantha TaxID=4533 RepID=J3NA34_ORYBR
MNPKRPPSAPIPEQNSTPKREGLEDSAFPKGLMKAFVNALQNHLSPIYSSLEYLTKQTGTLSDRIDTISHDVGQIKRLISNHDANDNYRLEANQKENVAVTKEVNQEETGFRFAARPASEAHEGQSIELRFLNKLKDHLVYTDDKITAEDGTAIKIAIFRDNQIVTSGQLSSARIEILVLHDKFYDAVPDNWTECEFDAHIVNSSQGTVLGGDLQLKLKNGRASCLMSPSKFRLQRLEGLNMNKESKPWKSIVEHVEQCDLEVRDKHAVLFFNCVHDLVGAKFRGRYVAKGDFNSDEQDLVNSFKEQAYDDLDNIDYDHEMKDNYPVPLSSTLKRSIVDDSSIRFTDTARPNPPDLHATYDGSSVSEQVPFDQLFLHGYRGNQAGAVTAIGYCVAETSKAPLVIAEGTSESHNLIGPTNVSQNFSADSLEDDVPTRLYHQNALEISMRLRFPAFSDRREVGGAAPVSTPISARCSWNFSEASGLLPSKQRCSLKCGSRKRLAGSPMRHDCSQQGHFTGFLFQQYRDEELSLIPYYRTVAVEDADLKANRSGCYITFSVLIFEELKHEPAGVKVD